MEFQPSYHKPYIISFFQKELRLEDYDAGRKGSSTSIGFGSLGGTGLFGATSNAAGTSLFGSSTVSKPSVFGGRRYYQYILTE